ncbi:MAG: hypothetical protein ACKVOR_10915 [Flavobacteriales bacterium]
MIFNQQWNMGNEHWSYLETLGIVSSGAALWAFIFFHFGEYIFGWLATHFGTKRRKFTRRNRWFVRVKRRWGLKGLLLISGLISVPIASVICAKLYRHNSTALPKLIIAFFVWTVVLTSAAYGMKILGMNL